MTFRDEVIEAMAQAIGDTSPHYIHANRALDAALAFRGSSDDSRLTIVEGVKPVGEFGMICARCGKERDENECIDVPGVGISICCWCVSDIWHGEPNWIIP